MNIVKIGYSLNRSIRMADYKYYKLGVWMEADVSAEGEDSLEKPMAELKHNVEVELQKAIDAEKQTYKRHIRIAELKTLISKYGEGTTERLLAEQELERQEAGSSD